MSTTEPTPQHGESGAPSGAVGDPGGTDQPSEPASDFSAQPYGDHGQYGYRSQPPADWAAAGWSPPAPASPSQPPADWAAAGWSSPPSPPQPPADWAAGGWAPPPPPAGRPATTGRRRRLGALAAAAAVTLGAAGVGAGVGAALAHPRSSSPALAQSSTSLPSTGGGNGFGGGGRTGTGSGSGNSGDTTSPATGASPAATGTNSANDAAVAAKVDPGVVDITTTLGYQSAKAAGTGMILTSSGEVLTNNHVIDGATKITAQIDGQGTVYTAKVVGTDPTADVAVLQLQGASGLKTVKLGDASKVAVGDVVVAIGNALNRPGPPSVTDGTITAVDQSITAGDAGGGNSENLTGLFQTNALLQPGDSGGPLSNAAGEVIGMDTAASSGTQFSSTSNVGFAIPINTARAIADQIVAGHSSATIHLGLPAFLGVEIQSSSGSALVAGVASGTPAQSAGLAAGDTIVSVDGTAINSASDLSATISGHRPGDTVKVGWVDQAGQNHTASVQLATGPAD